MSTDVIKEFLVGLGFKVDQSSEQKFTASIKGATAGAVALGNVYADAAEKVAQAVQRMAAGMEDLYFMAQRTKASAERIQELGYAASQMGSSVDSARGSIEGLAKFLRENPGGEGLLASIGVQTRDVNGGLRDTTEIMADIGKRLARMPQYRAIAYANVFGIDYRTLMALEQGVDRFGNRYRDMLKRFGLNVGEATEKSHKLMMAWRDMKASAGILSTVVGTTLIGVFDELQHRWESLDQTTRDNIESGAKWLAGIAAIGAVIAGGPIAWIAALAAGILALWDDYQVWKEGGKSLIDWARWEPEIRLATNAIRILGNVIKDAFEWLERLSDKVLGGTKLGDWIGDKVARGLAAMGDADAQAAVDQTEGKTTPAKPGGKVPLGIRNNNPGNLRTGANGAFGRYATGQEGLAALARQLRAYYNGTSAAAGHRKLQTIGDIIRLYAPSSENDTGAYIAALAKQMGVKPGDHIDLNDPAQLASMMRGIVQHENGQNPYSAEMFARAAGAPGAAVPGGTRIDQNVDIHLHGSANPHETAEAVKTGVNQANDRLVRNLQGAAS